MFYATAMFVNRRQATCNERTAVQATRICATAHGKPQHQWLAPCCETDSALVPVGSVDPAGPPPSWVVRKKPRRILRRNLRGPIAINFSVRRL